MNEATPNSGCIIDFKQNAVMLSLTRVNHHTTSLGRLMGINEDALEKL